MADALTAVLPPGRLIVNDHEWFDGFATIELKGTATPYAEGEALTQMSFPPFSGHLP